MFLRLFAFLFFLIFNLTIYAQDTKDSHIEFGGALRYNIFAKSWVADQTQPEFTWDTWRLNIDGAVKGVDLSFEYRFYPSSNTHFLHHGYFGYDISKDLYVKLGVSQVPFGIASFASNNYFFQGQYYFGLEDDYDMGINFSYTGIKNLALDLAYFREAEPAGSGGINSRYSYDVVAGNGYSGNNKELATIKELNQANLRAVYNIIPEIKLGISGQVGGIYNQVLDKSTWSTALAAHLHGTFKHGWDIKASYINHHYNAVSDLNNKLDIVPMGAYGATYGVAAKANTYSAGLSKTFKVNWGFIEAIEAHMDYAYIDKTDASFFDTQQLVPGIVLSGGPFYIYMDYAMGKNHPWLTPSFGDGLDQGEATANWEKRFNINLGYYF